jgi:hypothetical protein
MSPVKEFRPVKQIKTKTTKVSSNLPKDKQNDLVHPDSKFHPLAQRSQPYDWCQALKDTD